MSALADRDSNITPTSNPQERQSAGGEENKPQETQQHRDVLEQKNGGSNECVHIHPREVGSRRREGWY